jgi:hypothetical protein
MEPAAPDNRTEPSSPPPDLRTLSQQLAARLARMEEEQRQWQEQEAAKAAHHERLREIDRQAQERSAATHQLTTPGARLEATHHQAQEAQTPADPEAIRARIKAETQTTPADLQHMLGRDRYPTWVHAAYADLAGRMARLEAMLQELEASMSLLHAKMEMLIMQRAMEDRAARED